MQLAELIGAAAIGAIASLVASALKTRFMTKSANSVITISGPTGQTVEVTNLKDIDPETVKAEILRNMLKDPRFRFREFSTLKRAIGLEDDDKTKELLFKIGARPNLAVGGRDTWTLLPP